ncbi:MAG TPA: erythromycin esterase family protein [Holophaga sp.]|nr:erythromycin esterase family protein [Holophaga sp.]
MRFLPSLMLLAGPMAAAHTLVHFQGMIVGAGRAPVNGAFVSLAPLGGAAASLLDMPRIRTGAEGRFELDTPAGTYWLSVTAAGHVPVHRKVVLAPGRVGTGLQIRLAPGGCPVKGRLVVQGPACALEGVIGFVEGGGGAGRIILEEVRSGRFETSLRPGDWLAITESEGCGGALRFTAVESGNVVEIPVVRRPSPAGPEVAAWLTRHAIPLAGSDPTLGLEDLRPIAAGLRGAQVVGMGEATHGTREFFQLKHRLFRLLVEDLGFTSLAMEAGVLEAEAVDAYVRTGVGDPAKALAGLGFWTWETQEVLALVRWMRAYNEDPAHPRKLSFHGLDMQFDDPAWLRAQAWLDRTDTKRGTRLRALRRRMRRLDPRGGAKGWLELAQDLRALAADKRREVPSGMPAEVPIHSLELLAQWASVKAHPEDPVRYRDTGMAANLQWLRGRDPEARIAVWTHNGHASFHRESLTHPLSLGFLARQAWGDAYRAIGFAFQAGWFRAFTFEPPPGRVRPFHLAANPLGTLDAWLAGAGEPFLALDLRALPEAGPAGAWLATPQRTWSIGAVFAQGQDPQYLLAERAGAAYDFLIFVRDTHASLPLADIASGQESSRGGRHGH